MRFAITAILVVIAVFTFYVGYSVCTFLLSSIYNSLEPFALTLSSSNAIDDMKLISGAFGIICAFIVVIIIVVFVLDSLSDEPEMYWKE